MKMTKDSTSCGIGALAVLLIFTSLTSPALAEDHTDNHTLVDDLRLYVTAPARWDKRDWLYAGSVVAAIAASHHYDNQVRAHFINSAPLDTTDKYSTRDALPAAGVLAGTWALSFVWDDTAGYREGRNMIEASAFSVASVYIIKQVAHRERPYVTADSNRWKHGDSFPSLHVTFAGAIGGVLAESGGDDYRWVRRVLGYGLVAGSAYLRLKHNQHWLSDTVAGAALGLSTAHFVVNRNQPHHSVSTLSLLPIDGGLALNYSASFH
ncbi:MAG: phosphatase PAP2 family protein [Steroidobacter sp.]